jgi:hypothetical protein
MNRKNKKGPVAKLPAYSLPDSEQIFQKKQGIPLSERDIPDAKSLKKHQNCWSYVDCRTYSPSRNPYPHNIHDSYLSLARSMLFSILKSIDFLPRPGKLAGQYL